jgi:hypothetical protein
MTEEQVAQTEEQVAQLVQLRAMVALVKVIHEDSRQEGYCSHDGFGWPCPTALVVYQELQRRDS